MSAITSTDYTALDLPSLALAIVSENGRAIRTAKTAVDHAIRCGEMLIAAKAKVPHGEWESWVMSETEISLRTASRYMQSAMKSATLADLEPDLAIAEALEMVTTPATVKQEPAKAPKPPKPAAVVTVDAEIVKPLPEHKPLHAAIKEHLPTIAPDPVHDAIDRLVFVLIHHKCSADYINGLAESVTMIENANREEKP